MVIRSSYFGDGKAPVIFYYFYCSSGQSSLLQCDYSDYYQHYVYAALYCGDDEAAGVICLGIDIKFGLTCS